MAGADRTPPACPIVLLSFIGFTPAGGSAAGFLPPYGTSTCGGYQSQQRDQEDLSLEVVLTSPGDQPLRWVAGEYFADIDRHVVVSQGSDLAPGFKARPFVHDAPGNSCGVEMNYRFWPLIPLPPSPTAVGGGWGEELRC